MCKMLPVQGSTLGHAEQVLPIKEVLNPSCTIFFERDYRAGVDFIGKGIKKLHNGEDQKSPT